MYKNREQLLIDISNLNESLKSCEKFANKIYDNLNEYYTNTVLTEEFSDLVLEFIELTDHLHFINKFKGEDIRREA